MGSPHMMFPQLYLCGAVVFCLASVSMGGGGGGGGVPKAGRSMLSSLVAGPGAVLFAWARGFPCLREGRGVSIPDGTLLSESMAPWLELRGRPCTTPFDVTISGDRKEQFMSLPMIA